MISFEMIIHSPDNATEYYVITKSKEGVWITKESGEGMELTSEHFYKAFKKLYNENF